MSYYLKRKDLGKTVSLNAIGDIAIYKHELWDFAGYMGFFISLFFMHYVIWVSLCDL